MRIFTNVLVETHSKTGIRTTTLNVYNSEEDAKQALIPDALQYIDTNYGKKHKEICLVQDGRCYDALASDFNLPIGCYLLENENKQIWLYQKSMNCAKGYLWDSVNATVEKLGEFITLVSDIPNYFFTCQLNQSEKKVAKPKHHSDQQVIDTKPDKTDAVLISKISDEKLLTMSVIVSDATKQAAETKSKVAEVKRNNDMVIGQLKSVLALRNKKTQ